jgi:predicted aconitase with swiveling domain
MSFNKSPLAFDDIREAFNRALEAPKGIRILCTTRGAAILLRSRFNYFRKVDRQANRAIYDPEHSMHSKSIYDRLVLRIPPKGSVHDNTLIIEPITVDNLTIEEIT